MPIERNELETQRFGIVAAGVTDPAAPLARINARATALGVQMLSARLDACDLARVQGFEADGFRLMDTLVYYRIALARPDADAALPEMDTPDIRLRAATPADADGVAAVARDSFAGYIGHYHADPRLSDTDADAVYVDWARRSIDTCGPETPAVVAEAGGMPVGFMSTRVLSGRIGEIVLNAVHPRLQGQGVYGRMLDRSLATLAHLGCEAAVVSTQLTNIVVQRAWVTRGLRLTESRYTLHKWY